MQIETELKIFFGKKCLILCSKISDEIEKLIRHEQTVFIDELNNHSIKAMLYEMEQPEIVYGIFYHQDLEELKKAFWKKFTIIKAGGGIVVNNLEEILLIFRRGKWDLPKGKLDENETIEECALREVKEETGLQQIEMNKFFKLSYHTYTDGTKHVLKENYWYVMNAKFAETLKPQLSEDITEIRWVKKDDLKNYFADCFISIRDLLKTFLSRE